MKLASLPVGDQPTAKQLQRTFPEISSQQLELLLEHDSQKQASALMSQSRNQLTEYIAGLLLSLKDVRGGIRKMKNHGRKDEKRRTSLWCSKEKNGTLKLS